MSETKKVCFKYNKNDNDTMKEISNLCSKHKILWCDDDKVTMDSLTNTISHYGETYLILTVVDGEINLSYSSTGFNYFDEAPKILDNVQGFFNLALVYRNEQLGVDADTEGVKNQPHYKNNSIEPIEYMKQNFTKEEYRGFLQGNVHKYMARYKDKNGLEDLKKAKVYLEWLIEDVALNGLELDKEPKGML